MGAVTWLSSEPTVTTFIRGIRGVRALHSHGHRTEAIIEGVKKDEKRFEECKDSIRILKSQRKHKEKEESEK